ncbi:MAG TPA: hypothetical protein VF719_07840 [Abditibacteriaceae bacterium]|jgi:hypothetical protein
MNGKSNDIVAELRGIKKVLIVVAACLCVGAASNVYHIVDDMRENTERRLGRTFHEQADTLRREREWDELLKLAQNRQAERPRDPSAFWFSGVAHLYRDEFDQAASDFRRTVEIDTAYKKFSDRMLKRVADKRKEKAKSKGAKPSNNG